MKIRGMKNFKKNGYSIAACSAMVLALASCGEDTGSQGAAMDVNKGAMSLQQSLQGGTQSTEEAVSPAKQTRDEIFNLFVYNLAPKLASPDSAVAPHIKETLRLLNELYEHEKATNAGTADRVNMAFTIAEMRRSFGAWNAAIGEYDRTLEDFNALADDVKSQAGSASMLSSIYYGKAYCYLQKGDSTNALAQYDLRLQNDEARAASLFGERAEKKMTDLEAVILHDLISSMRTRAECLAQTDPEEARTAFAEYIDRVDDLMYCHQAATHMQYIRLISSAANLEARCNNNDKAIEYCGKVAIHCQNVHNGTNNASIRQMMLQQIKVCQEMVNKLRAGESIEETAPAPEAAPTEPLQQDLPELPSTEPAAPAADTPVAAVTEPAPVAAEQTTAKSTKSTRSKTRNRR